MQKDVYVLCMFYYAVQKCDVHVYARSLCIVLNHVSSVI